MSMATDNNRKDVRRQIFFSVAGIGVGLLVAGLIALLINNVIEPTMQVETRDLVEFPGETFSLWYHVNSPYTNTRDKLIEELEEDLDALLVRLQVNREDIPLPIDVLVHDTPSMMQTTTLRRKSASALYSFYCVIDLLQGEDPLQRLAELVLAFGWGNCSSQLIYVGMLANIVESDRDFHMPVSAAPDRLIFSLDDLVALESAGQFEETLYQRYQSPFSARLAVGSFESMGEFRSMLTKLDDEAAEYGMADFEAASLVEYLIDCSGGLDEFRAAWGPGTTAAVLGRLNCGSLDEIFEGWMASVHASDYAGNDFDYYRARFLFEAGDLSSAAAITDAWDCSGLTSSKSTLAWRTQIAVGDIQDASAFVSGADANARDTLEEWQDVYEGWSLTQNGAYSVLSSGDEVSRTRILDDVKSAYERVVDELALDGYELPSHITIVYYPDEESQELGSTAVPIDDTQRTLWHVASGDDLMATFAVTLPSYVVKKVTASNLLKTGLIAAVTIDREELLRRGCEILQSGDWTPLWRVGFGGLPEEIFQTQTGLMMMYVLETYGAEVIPPLWKATARIGGGQSLDSAFNDVLDTSRTRIESELVETVLDCE